MSGGGQKAILILVGVILGSCLLCGIGFYAYLEIMGEPYTETYREPPEAVVRQNPFYAAQRVLTVRGIETESVPTLGAVDLEKADFELLLLLDDRRPLPQSRAQALKAWIEDGGHLVCVAPAPEDDEPQQDPLLEAFEIETSYTYSSFSESEEPVESEVGPLGGATDVGFAYERGLLMPFGLSECDWVWTEDSGTVHGLSLAAGKGRLTVVSDAEIWKNPGAGTSGGGFFSIQTADISADHHARLLWELSSAWRSPTRAVLVYDDAYPSLWTLLARNCWPLLVSLAVLLVVWLVGSSRRFGPLLFSAPLARRSLLEHLEAAGHFMWRQDAHKPLVEASREALRAQIRRRRAHLTHLSDEQLVSALSQDLGIPQATVHHALCAPIPDRAEGFTVLVANVERLRRAL